MHRVLVLTGLAIMLSSSDAAAHWCDTLWTSNYNVVVRPESDTLEVPDGEAGRLRVWVQNNMAYPLVYFSLDAWADDSAYTITMASSEPTVPGFLMPGEKLTYWLTVTRPGGGTLDVESIHFDVLFGADRGPNIWCDPPNDCGDQDSSYGVWNQSREVMLKKPNGDLFPARQGGEVPNLLPYEQSHQGKSIRSSARADYGDFDQAIADLFHEWCAGRASWSPDGYTLDQYCPAETPTEFVTNCPGTTATGDGWGWLYQHLWATGELAYRQHVLTPRQLTTFRERLMCGWNDEDFTFTAFVAFVLGYLGDDAEVGAFLALRADDGDDVNPATPEELVARAALYMMGDTLLYEQDMDDCLTAGDGSLPDYEYAEMVCAAAINIVEGEDAVVETELFGRIAWIIPDDDSRGMFAGHLTNLLAWHQRYWQVDAGDLGEVSFYGGIIDSVAPAAPQGVQCSAIGDTIQVTWLAVDQDVGGNPEIVSTYRVYFGEQPNTCGTCTGPGMGFDYDHVEPTTNTWLRPGASLLAPGTTYYFAVMAVDRQVNESVFSEEVSCAAALPQNPPVAQIDCSPTSGPPPLSVACTSNSTDLDGNIASTLFRVEGQDHAGATLNHEFATPGTFEILLTVIDATGLWDTASVVIDVTDPSGNQAPVALALLDVASGFAPLTVQFDGSGSNDTDGSITAYAWDFGDGTTDTGAIVSHTYDSPGLFVATLTVTDNATTPRTGEDSSLIEVLENHPPDLTAASVSPLYGQVPLQIHADATGVIDEDQHTVTFAWDFGDGSPTEPGAGVDHTYATVGVYTVVLTATDELGLPAQRSFVVSAGNTPPDASSATVTPLAGPAPLTVSMDASGSIDADNDTLSCEWELSNGVTLQDAVAEYTFESPGTYVVTLRVRDDGYPPLMAERSFQVEVTDTSGTTARGNGCTCSGTGSGWALVALLLVPLVRRRRVG